MLETFSLRQQLDMVRQELSQALYQHDAACRVIARLMRERDEARSMITSLQANGFSVSSTVPRANGAANVEAIESVAESDVQMEVSEVSGKAVGGVEGSTALDEKVMADVNSKWEELSTLRKQRKVSDDLASKSAVMKMSVQSSFTPHKADKSSGVTSVAVCDAFGDSGSPVILSAGTDKTAIITDRTSGKVISKLTGHTKRVCSAVFHPSADSKVIFTSSADGSVKVLVLIHVAFLYFF